MIVKFDKRFLKDLSRIPSIHRLRIENYSFNVLPNCNSLSEPGNIEKLRGYKFYYKVRFGEYRLGIRQNNEGIVLERVLHRKDIYKVFP